MVSSDWERLRAVLAGVPSRVIYEHEPERIEVSRVSEPDAAVLGSLSWISARREALRTWCGSVLLTDLFGFPDVGCPSHPHVVVYTRAPRLLMARAMAALLPERLVEPVRVDRDPGTTLVHETAVVGESGFGWIWNGKSFERFPHIGGVVLGAGVEVAHGARVQRGVIGDTVIGEGTKIGPGANVGHGVRTGRHCLLATGCSLAGSVVLGDRVTVWQGAMVAHSVRIGDRAVIGMGAVVLHDVPEGETWAGNPARRIRQA